MRQLLKTNVGGQRRGGLLAWLLALLVILGWAGRVAAQEPIPANPAGTFSFVSDEFTITELESIGPPNTFRSIPGALITVNRMGGSTGRVLVDWMATEVDQGIPVGAGTMIFDDGQTSTNFFINLYDIPPISETNQDVRVMLELIQVLPAPEENPDVIQPALDPALSVAQLTMLNLMDYTNRFSFGSLNWRVDEYNNRQITVTVVLPGRGEGNSQQSGPVSVELRYGLDYFFPLAPGSDYANDEAYTGVDGFVQPQDFETGSIRLYFRDVDVSRSVTLTVRPDALVEFNEDIPLLLRDPAGNNRRLHPPASQAVVTILYDDMPPGAVDRQWNPPNVSYTTPPFNRVPGANNQVLAVAVQPDGKTIIGGDFTGVNAVSRNRLARFNVDGSLDTNFMAFPNSGADGFVSKVVVLTNGPDAGKILIAGGFTSYNGILRNSIARLLPNGALDPAFTPGSGANAAVWDLAVQNDGKIVVVGDFTRFNEADRNYIARLNSNGTLDNTFAPVGGANDSILAVALDESNPAAPKAYIGGRFTYYGGEPRGHVARVNADGSADATFNPGRGSDGPVYTLAMQSDGKLLIGGAFTEYNSRRRNNIARLLQDGGLDFSYDPGDGADDAIYTITMRPDGQPYIGGIFSSYNNTRRIGLALLRPDGTLDTHFMDQAYNQFAGVIRKFSFDPKNSVNAIALQPDGNLMIGGSFTNLGGNHPLQINESGNYLSVWTRQDKTTRFNVARIIGTWGTYTDAGGAVVAYPPQGPGNLDYSMPLYSVDENQPTMAVTMYRNDGILGTAVGLAVTSNRTAVADQDYTGRETAMSFPQWYGWMVSEGFPGPRYFTIPILDDALVEGDETLDMGLYTPTGQIMLGGEYIPLGAALGRRFANLTIIDDDFSRGTIVFSPDTYLVSEADNTNAVLTLWRTNGFTGTVSVDYYTVSGTALAGSDYTYRSNRVTFYSGETNKTIQIPILNDTVGEPDEDFYVVLTNATGGATLPGGLPTSTTMGTVTIIDNDIPSGQINFTPTSYTVNEGPGVNAALTVTRTGGNVGPLSVSVVTVNGTAAAGVDYVYTSNRLSWTHGDTTPRTVLVPILGDEIFTPDRQFTARLINPSTGSALGSRTEATVTIVNDDFPGTLSFSQAAYVGDENGTNVTISVLRSGGSAGTVTVDYATQDGTALAGVDFVAANGTLTFGPGEVNKTFDVRLLDNVNQAAAPLTFNLALSAPTGGAGLGTVATATFTIMDDESFAEPAGSLDTTYLTGTGMNQAVYALALQPNTNLLVGGEFTAFNNIPQRSLTRVMPDGSLDSSFDVGSGFSDQLRAIALQPDGKLVIGGFFTNVNGINRSRVARLNVDGSLDTFFNPGAGADNPVYALAIQPDDGRILIGGNFTTFNGVTRPNLARLNTNGTLHTLFNVGNGPNGVVYAIAIQPDGKILIGGDFTQINNIPQNRLARLHRDGSLDTNFLAAIGSGADAPVRAITVQSDGRILVGGSFTNFAGAWRPFLVRLEPSGATDASFLAGQSGPNDAVYAITIQVDEKILLGGAFTRVNDVTRNRIARLNRDGATDPSINFGLGANGFVSAIVVQPDRKIILGGGFTSYDGKPRNNLARIHGGSLQGSGSFEFSRPFYTVVENEVVAVLEVVRRGGTFGAAAVQAMTADGTAVEGVDYAGQTNTFVFPQGEVVQTLGIPLVDDRAIEEPETVYAFLDNATGGAGIGVIPAAVVTILSDDSEVGFANPVFNVAENTASGSAPITVVRRGATNGAISVHYATVAGTATPGLDYTTVWGTLTFQPGETNKVFLAPIRDDVLVEGNEVVNLILTNAQPENIVVPGLTNAVLNIIDNEWAPGELAFSSAAYMANETSTNAIITVVRTNGTTGIVSVRYATSNDTAIAGINYIETSGILSFADGETVKTFAVPLLDDHQPGADKTCLLSLFSPGGGAALGALTNAVLTIEENEPGASYVLFSAPVFGANEFDPYGIVTITRTNSRRGILTVDFATEDGTAVAGRDYIATNLTVTLYDNQSSTNVFIPLINDQAGSPDRTVRLRISNPSSGFISTPQGLLVITNDDTSLQFSEAAYTVLKSGTNAVLTVTRLGVSNTAVSVVYQTVADGTAVAGLDFEPTAGVLTWGPFDTAPKTVLVPIIYHAGYTPDKTFSVTLSGALGGLSTYVGTPGTAVVSILNDEVFIPPAGQVDPGFNASLGANATVRSVLFDGQRRLYAGGDFTYVYGLRQNSITRLTPAGTVDTSFNIGTGFNGPVRALMLAGDRLIAGGDFTSYNGQRFDRVAVLDTNGAPVPGFAPNFGADDSVRAIGLVLLGVTNFFRSSFQGTQNSDVNNLTVPVIGGVLNMDATFRPLPAQGTNPPVTTTNTLAITYGGGLLYAGTVVVSNAPVAIPIRNLAFGPGAATVLTIAVNAGLTNGGPWDYQGYMVFGGEGDRPIYLAGSFLLVNGTFQGRVARLRPDGSVDQNFNVGAGANGAVNALATLTNGQVLVAGEFTAFNTILLPGVARLNLDGSVDESFNPGLGADGAVRAMAVQDDGRILLGGDFTSFDGVPYAHVIRLNADGSVDLTFDPGTGPDGPVHSIGIQPDGRIVIAGDFSNVAGNHFARVARLNADGSLDVTFNPGSGANAAVYALALSASAKQRFVGVVRMPQVPRIVGGAPVSIYQFPYQVALLNFPYNPNNIYNDQFCGGSIISDRWILTAAHCVEGRAPVSLAVGVGITDLTQPQQGRIFTVDQVIVHPAYDPITAQNDIALLHLTQPIDFTGTMYAAAPVRLASPADVAAGYTAPGVMATITGWGNILSAGVNYPNILQAGAAPITTVSLYPPGQITPDMIMAGYVQGGVDSCQGDSGGPMVVTNAANEILQAGVVSWGNGCALPGYPGVYARVSYFYDWIVGFTGGSVVGPSGSAGLIAVGGEFTRFNEVPRERIAVLDGSGSLDASFDPGAAGNVAVYSIGLFTNTTVPHLVGKMLVGGDFTAISGAQVNRLARLNVGGTIDTNFNLGAGPNAPVYAVAIQPDGRAIVAGAFTNISGVRRAYVARILTNGVVDSTFNTGTGPDGVINALALQPDGRVVIGGQFTRVYGASRNGVARLYANGTVDTSFSPGAGANGAVRAVAVQPDGRVLVGGVFSAFDGTPCSHLVRLTSAGAIDGTFALPTGVDGAVNAIAVQADGRILVGGEFTTFNGLTNVGRLVRLNADGTVDASYHIGAGGDDYVSAIALQADGKALVAGGFLNWNGQTHRRLIRLDTDGSIDATINFGTGANNFIAAVAVESYDDKIVVGGAFSEFNGEPRVALARLFGGTNTGPGAFRFTSANFNVNEDVGNAVVTVLRAGGATGTARVRYATSDDTAQSGLDYLPASGTLTFTNGEVEKTFLVPVINNGRVDPPRRFNVALSAPENAVLTAPSAAKVTLVDDDSVISFSGPEYVVNEGAINARLTVTRTGGNTRTLTVDCLTTTNGTAAPMVHYVPIFSRLVFSPGVSLQTVNIPVIDNAVTEPPLTVSVVLSNVVGPGTLGLSAATLTIVDNDPQPGVLSFATNSFSVLESGGRATITVARSGGYSGQVSVRAQTLGGTAVPAPDAGADYVSTNVTLTFAEGETNKTFEVAVLDDEIVEGNKTVGLQLVGPTGGATIGQGTATLTIADDDSYGSFVFAEPVFNVFESELVAQITVLRVGGRIGQASVSARTSGGTAVPGIDYLATSNVLNFAAGQTSRTFTVTLTDDALVQGTLTVGLILENPTGGAVIGAQGTAQLFILDNETSFSFDTTLYSVSEVGPYGYANVMRLGNTNAVTSVYAATSLGTARPGEDFVGTNVLLTFLPGETNKILAVAVINDTIAEGDEYLNLTLSSPSSGALGPIASARLYLLDNDTAFNFSSANYSVVESFTNAVITVVRVGATNGVSTVNWAAGGGTAENGVDYYAAGGTLTFLPGQATNTFTVLVLDDLEAEGDETVGLSLSGPTGGILGNQPTAVLTIVDNDTSVGFASTNLVVNEAATNAVITLVRRGVATSPLSVTFVTSNGTAVTPQDYTRVSNIVTWAANDVQPKQVLVPVVKDAVIEGTETVHLYLLNATGGAVASPDRAELNIVDDAGFIAFASVSVTNAVEGQDVLITLVRSGGTNGAVTVDYQVVGGTATPGVDFLYPTGTVAFGSGESTKTITLPMLADSVIEGYETIELALASPTGGASLGTPNRMSVIVLDANLGILIPAGSAIAPGGESGPVNGVIDPNETVTLLFALRNVGVVNATNLVGILLATNGVVMPNGSLTQTQTYGTIIAGGASVSVPYTFRAAGTNGGRITATLVLKEGANSPYTNAVVNFTYMLGSASFTFANADRIDINDLAPASPYPSVIRVSGINGPVSRVTVSVIGLNHAYPDDVDLLLVGPRGQKVMLMSDAGGSAVINNVTLNFDDAAAAVLPNGATIASGTYHAFNHEVQTDPFPDPPAPYAPITAPYSTNLSVFNGLDGNGDWQLYAVDDTVVQSGVINGGWSLTLQASEQILPMADLSVNLRDTPDPVITNALLTYVTSVTNHGPAVATGVMLTNTLPPGLVPVAVSLSQGTYTTQTNAGAVRVIGSLGSLVNGGWATMNVILRAPATGGQLLASAAVGAVQNDVNPGDNALAVRSTVVASPSLTITRKDNNVLVSWPASGGSYVLQQAASLTNPVWTNVPQTPTQVDGMYVVSIPVSAAAQFYRLRAQ